MPSVEILKNQGEVADFISAVIEEDGRLQMIRNSFGPADFETEVTVAVSPEDKDRLLLALLEKVFTGNTKALEDFRDFATAKGIGVAWFRWP